MQYSEINWRLKTQDCFLFSSMNKKSRKDNMDKTLTVRGHISKDILVPGDGDRWPVGFSKSLLQIKCLAPIDLRGNEALAPIGTSDNLTSHLSAC